MAAGKLNLYIEAGAVFQKTLVINQPRAVPTDPLVPMDFTGWVGKAQLRKVPMEEPSFEITLTFTEPRTSGTIELEMLPVLTSAIPCGSTVTDPKSSYCWALELTPPDGKTVRMLEGTVTISAEVVR
jgi:hypothetical protein